MLNPFNRGFFIFKPLQKFKNFSDAVRNFDFFFKPLVVLPRAPKKMGGAERKKEKRLLGIKK